MNHYRMTNGEKISKAAIDRKVRQAKSDVLDAQFCDRGWNYCEECERSSGRLDCSHTISVDECQKSGRAELAFDVSNIRVLCRECHKKHDKL